MSTVFVTGASGFIGGRVCRTLLAAGHRPVGLVREMPQSDAQIAGVQYVTGDVTDVDALRRVFPHEATAVVHLVGIITENRRTGQTFSKVHVGGTSAVVSAARLTGFADKADARLLYVSAQGADLRSPSRYSQTKATAEAVVQASNIPYTIVRPSLAIGPRGEFVRQMTQLIRRPPLSPFPLPFVPVPGNGQNLFQPVWVDDLATAIVRGMERDAARNQIIPVGGADRITFDTLLRSLMTHVGVKKPLLHLPMPLMFAAAGVLERVLSHPPITRDQLLNLKVDNVTDNTALETRLGVTPLGWDQMVQRLPKDG